MKWIFTRCGKFHAVHSASYLFSAFFFIFYFRSLKKKKTDLKEHHVPLFDFWTSWTIFADIGINVTPLEDTRTMQFLDRNHTCKC